MINKLHMWQGVLLLLTLLLVIAAVIGSSKIAELRKKIKYSVSADTYNTLLNAHNRLKEQVNTLEERIDPLQECTNYSCDPEELALEIAVQSAFFLKLITMIEEDPKLRDRLNAALVGEQTDETDGDQKTSNMEETKTPQ